jgi:hypothetical protein
MPANYTVIYHHPKGGTATFIYEDGEMSALAKGLDSEQFWVFKQVKALLLRNDEDDLAIASRMMAEYGFSAQVAQALPDLLAPVPVAASAEPTEEEIFGPYRRPQGDTFPIFQRMRHNEGEVAWRDPANPPVRVEAAPSVAEEETLITPFAAQPFTRSGEVHWRESDDDDHHA